MILKQKTSMKESEGEENPLSQKTQAVLERELKTVGIVGALPSQPEQKDPEIHRMPLIPQPEKTALQDMPTEAPRSNVAVENPAVTMPSQAPVPQMGPPALSAYASHADRQEKQQKEVTTPTKQEGDVATVVVGQAPVIHDARTFAELYKAFATTSGIPKGFITFPDLTNKSGRLGVLGLTFLIQKVRSDEKDISAVPADLGIQNKVEILLEEGGKKTKSAIVPETTPAGTLISPEKELTETRERIELYNQYLITQSQKMFEGKITSDVLSLVKNSENTKGILTKKIEARENFTPHDNQDIGRWFEQADAVRKKLENEQQQRLNKASATEKNAYTEQRMKETVSTIFASKGFLKQKMVGTLSHPWKKLKTQDARRFMTTEAATLSKTTKARQKDVEKLQTYLAEQYEKTALQPTEKETIEVYLKHLLEQRV